MLVSFKDIENSDFFGQFRRNFVHVWNIMRHTIFNLKSQIECTTNYRVQHALYKYKIRALTSFGKLKNITLAEMGVAVERATTVLGPKN